MQLTDKVLKKFEAELKKLKPNRDSLKTLHYTEEGHLEFTNSHVAVRLKDCHSDGEKTVPETDTTYPNLGRIFDTQSVGNSIKINVLEVRNMIAPFKTEKFDYVKMTFNNDSVDFEAPKVEGQSLTNAKLICQLDVPHNEPFIVSVNPKYLYNCLQLFNVLKIKEINLNYSSAVRPLLFEHENLQYLVTPMRIG